MILNHVYTEEDLIKINRFEKMIYTDNFLEIERKEEANLIDLNTYTFVTFSDKRGYVFKRRKGK